jgi:WD40 repeat protein
MQVPLLSALSWRPAGAFLMVRQRRPEPGACGTRRRFVTGALGALLSAPAILPSKAEAFPQTAQGGRNARDTGPQLRLERVGVWSLECEAVQFKFSPDGRFVASRFLHNIVVYEFPSGRIVARISNPGAMRSLTFGFGFEGKTLISLCRDRSADTPAPTEMVQIFDIESGRLLDRPGPPPLESRAGIFPLHVVTSLDGRYAAVLLAQGGKEKAIVVLDTKDTTVRRVLYQSAPRQTFQGVLAVSGDGLVAVAEYDPVGDKVGAPQRVAIFDSVRNERIADFVGTRQGVASLRWSPDGTLLAVGSQPLAPPAVERSNEGPNAPNSPAVRDAAWIWDLRERRTKLSLPFVHSPVMNAAISPDNFWLFTRRSKYSRDLGSGMSVWRVSDGAEMFAYETPDSRLINDVAFSPSGVHLAFAERNEFKVFRVIA